MTDFELLVAPHRAARRLPLPERYAAAVDWAEARIKAEFPSLDDVIIKLRTQQSLTKKEAAIVISALTKVRGKGGRPPTQEGRNLWIRMLVKSVAREFRLSATRGNESVSYSAADVVANAMSRAGLAPRGFDRIRKIHSKAAPEEVALVRAYFCKKEAERRGYQTLWEAEQKLLYGALRHS